MINIPDASLLSNATFERAGADLHLHGHDGQHVVIPGYFASAHHAALVAPDGERVSFDEIALLAGKYAAAQPANTANDATPHAGPNAIGHVDKITGDVTVQRNGMAVTLHAGDAIYKNDVIQTGSGSSVTISLTDGTAFNLVANTRMALNDYSFDGNSNHALFTLQEGTFGFVAGKIGDMRIATPVGFMSVHEGTTGWAHELSAKQIAAISAKLGKVTFSFAVVNTADSHGAYELLVKGAVVGDIGDPNLIWYLDQDGNLISMPLDHSQEFADGLPQNFLGWLETADLATRSLGIHGSGSPIDPSLFPQAVNLYQLSPSFDFNPGGGSGFTVTFPHATDDPNYAKLHSNIFIWNGLGNWDIQQSNWNQGFAPVDPFDIVIIQSGKASYTANYSIASLTVNFGATLNIAAGALTVSGLTNAGLIEINSSGVDPALVIDGAIALTGRGVIEMLGPTTGNFILGKVGSNATLINVDNIIGGSGNIGDGDAQLTFVNEGTVVAKPIHSADSGLLLVNTGNAVQNFGVFEAVLKGELLIEDRLFNFGTVEAIGDGSSVVIDNNSATAGGNVPANADGNAGLIQAILGGKVTIKDSTVINSGTGGGAIVDGLILAGAGSEIVLQDATILEGLVSVEKGGEIETVGGTTNRIDTSNGSHNTTQPSIVNAGRILLDDNSTLILASPFDIENSGTIELASTGNKTVLEFNQPFAILSGGGNVILDGGQQSGLPRNALNNPGEEGGDKGITPAQDIIDGLPGTGFAVASLENRDNTISGAGAIGQGNGALAFKNDKQGTVDSDLSNQTLLIATGANTIVNAGLFEATNGGELLIRSALDNSGEVIAHSRSEARIEADVLNEVTGSIVATDLFARVDIVGSVGARLSVDNFGGISALNGGTVFVEFADVSNEAGDKPNLAGSILADGAGSTVDIGQSTVDNHGTIVAQNQGLVAIADDKVTNEHDGLINATGKGSEVRFDRDRVKNAGVISAEQRGEVVFDQSRVGNEADGSIAADGKGSLVEFDHDRVHNSGLIEAEAHGKVAFEHSHIDNRSKGIIAATGRGSEVRFDHDHVDNSGLVEAEKRGGVVFEHSHIDNDSRGTIEATGRGSEVKFDRDHVDNSGTIEAQHRGKVKFEHSHIDNERRGIIEADGWGSHVTFKYDQVDNSGLVTADDGGEVEFKKSHIDNDRHGTIEADGRGSEVRFEHDHVDNSGLIKAEHGGEVEFEKSHIDNERHGTIEADGKGAEVELDRDRVHNSGRIEAEHGGKVELERSHVDNERRGIIEADGWGSQVEFKHDHVENAGSIEADTGGEISFYASHVENDYSGAIEADGKGAKIDFVRGGIANRGFVGASRGGSILFDKSWVNNERSGEIEAGGKGSTVTFKHDHVENSGEIEASRGGEVELTGSDIANHRHGSIEADGRGSKVEFERDGIGNWGTIGAVWGGSVFIEESWVWNEHGGNIEADAKGSEVTFKYDYVDNSGRIQAEHGGEIDVDKSYVENDRRGIIEADGWASEISFDHTVIGNRGAIRATFGGAIEIEDSWVGNDGEIEAGGRNSQVEFRHDRVHNFGDIDARLGGEVAFHASHVDNRRHGKIEADGKGSEIAFVRSDVDNSGTIEANHAGEVDFDRAGIDNDGTIKAVHGGKVSIEHSDVDNRHGQIAADGSGSIVDFDRSYVKGGTLGTAGGGLIEVVGGTSTFRDLTIAAGSRVHVGASSFGKLALKGDIEELGTISVSLGGELDLIWATVDGQGSGVIHDLNVVDVLRESTLQDITVELGRLDVEDGVTLHLEGDVHLDGVDVHNGGSIIVDRPALGPAELLMDDGTAIVGGRLTINELGTVDVEHGQGSSGVHGAVLDGVIVTDGNSIEIGVTDLGVDSPAILTLTGGTKVSGAGTGKVEINAGAEIDIERGAGRGHGATLDGLKVIDNGAIIVGKTSKAVLTLDDDTSITGGGTGALTVAQGSKLDIETGATGTGAVLDGVSVSDDGSIEIGAKATLAIGHTVTLSGSGSLSMRAGSQITDNGEAAILDNSSTIAGQGTIGATIGGNHLALTNEASGVIDASVAGATLVLDAAIITNKGILEATNGATLDIRSDVTNTVTASIAAHDDADDNGSVLRLEAVTVSNGSITIDTASTLKIENGTNILDNVNIDNEGSIQIDDPAGDAVTATLVLDGGTHLAGRTVHIGASGELDVNNAIFGKIVIDDAGVFELNGPLTLEGSFRLHIDAGGTFVDHSTITIADGKLVTMSGSDATFNEIDIGNNATVELSHANATVVDFKGADGTLVLDASANFTGTIKDLRAGDIIDLKDVAASSVVLDGTTLKINGTATSFAIAGGLPSGDTLAFKADGHGGTVLKVAPQLLTVSTQPIAGTESSAILVNFSDHLDGGATLKTVTISGIPFGAMLSNAEHDAFPLITGGTIMLTPAALAGLTITPPNDSNFTLSIVATAQDSHGFQYSAAASETVTVSPLAPSVSWAAGSQLVDGEGETAAIALDVGLNGTASDGNNNSIASVVISGIQVGAVLSDGNPAHIFTADATHTSQDVTNWDLAHLTITPASTTNFKLTATVTEKDGDGETSTSQADLKIVTGTDWVEKAGGDWTVTTDWDHGVPTAGLGAAIDASVVNATADYVVYVHDAEVAHALTVNDVHATLTDAETLTIGRALTVDAGTVDVAKTHDTVTPSLTAGSLAIHGGLVDVQGGDRYTTDGGFGGPGNEVVNPGGVLTVNGAIVVDGGKLLVEAGTDSTVGHYNYVYDPAYLGTLNAASIEVKTGGIVELDGTVNVPLQNGSGENLIVVNGGNLTVGSTANFLGASVLTFGENGGTITFAQNGSGGYYASPVISGFGPGGKDVIDLPNVAYQSNASISTYYDYFSGNTYLTVGGKQVALEGKYSAVDFALVDDGIADPVTHQDGTKIVWGLATPTIDVTGGPGSYTVTVTLKDIFGNAVEGIDVAPTYTGVDNPGQGAWSFFNNLYVQVGNIRTEQTDENGQAKFTFDSFGYSGTYDISMLVDRVETVSTEIDVPAFTAVSWRSSLTSQLRFAGPNETATLTLTDRDPNLNPRSGDHVTWAGSGTFSPGNTDPNDVTDVNGHLVSVFDPRSNTAQTVGVSATFGDPGGQATVSTSVNFVAMDTWINSSGGLWSDPTGWSGGVVPDASHAAWIGVDGTYTVTVASATFIYGLGTSATATLDITSALTVNGDGVSVLAGDLTLDGGVLLVQRGEVDLDGAVTNNGNLIATNGGIINVAGDITGQGLLRVDGGQINVAGTVPASEQILINGAGVVHLKTTEAGHVIFASAGMLALDAAPASSMRVSGFGRGDSIDLTNLAWSANIQLSWDSTNQILTVDNGTGNESIHFAEGHSLSDFSVHADPLGSGGIDIVYVDHSASYASATSYLVVHTAGTGGIGAINNANVAVVVGSSATYYDVNGHLVPISGAPTYDTGGYGLYFTAGLNDNGTVVVTDSDRQENRPVTYTGKYDSATNLNDLAHGSLTEYRGPGELQTSNSPSFFGQGLGINNSNEVVGWFGDEKGLELELHANYSRVFTLNGVLPMPRYNGGDNNPVGNIVHEYGFIYKPGSGYLIVDVGNTAHVTGLPQFLPSTGSAGFASSTRWGYIEDNHQALDGVAFTALTAINNNGIAVGYYVDDHSVQHAFIFNSNNDTFTYLPDLRSSGVTSDTVATGINDAGIVVGYYAPAFGTGQLATPRATDYTLTYGFVYDTNTGQFITTDFSVAGYGDHVSLTGINNNGMVTGLRGSDLITANVLPITTIDDGGTLYLDHSFNATQVQFAGGTGKLVLSNGFTGEILGFSGTGASFTQSDVIDLVGANYVESPNFHVRFSNGVLSVQEGFGPSYTLTLHGYTGNLVYDTDGHGGTLIFDPPSGGETTIANGQMLEVTGPDDGTITFAGHQGKLQLDDAAHFTGSIKGFASDAAHSDAVDLSGFDTASTVFTQKNVDGNLVVTATEGGKVAILTFDHVDGALNLADDGHGGTMITNSAVASGPGIGTVDATVTEAGVHGTITAADPGAAGKLTTSVQAEGANDVGAFSVHAATSANGTASVAFNFDFGNGVAPSHAVTQSYDVTVKDGASTVLHQTVSVSVGTANADNFVFAPGVGADTIVNFDTQHDTIDLSHFHNIPSVQQLSSLTTTNAHGDAVIDLGNHDSITIAGVTAAQLQQVMQNVVHLH